MSDYVGEVIDSWRTVRPDLDTSPVAVTLRIERAAQAIRTRLDGVVGAHEPLGSKGDLDTLTTLRRAGNGAFLTPSTLATAGQLTSGGMTNRLDRLEAAGLVQRTRDPNDRRGIRVALTPAGARLADQTFEDSLEVQRSLLQPLSATEQERLSTALESLLEALDDRPLGIDDSA